jgi:hypothetical protein
MLLHSLPPRSHPVSDVIFIAVLVAFFVLCALYVQLCDRMIGSDELAMAVKGADTPLDGESPTLTTAGVGSADGVTS